MRAALLGLMLVAAVFIGLPLLAVALDGAPAPDERTPALQDAADRLDDCLAKAVAGQPPGRPARRLLYDLGLDCAAESILLERALGGGPKARAEVFKQHFEPAALRADPL